VKEQTRSAIKLLEALTERAKELSCLYAIEEILREPDQDIERVCNGIIQAIPPGWQYPDVCVARIALEGEEYCSPGIEETQWNLSANIVQQDQKVGAIDVYYTCEMPPSDVGVFLKEEKKLIETIADRLNYFLTYKKMKQVFQERQIIGSSTTNGRGTDWQAVLDLIRQTDHALFIRLSNKMLNHLCWSGIAEAETLRLSNKKQNGVPYDVFSDEGTEPTPRRPLDFSTEFTERIFNIASGRLGNEEILSRIQMWIQEDKLGALLRTVRRRLPHSEVTNGLRRYFISTLDDADNRYPLARGLKVLLIERILSDRVNYINIVKDYVDIVDLYQLLQNVICPAESHGKLGGKSAGLFLVSRILKKSNNGIGPDSPFRVPKTWYISSDLMLEFIHYNNMDEVIEQKYKDIERVRFEYSHVIDMFRQSVHPPEMANGLSMVLDEMGDNPLVVRSSSLLEGRTGNTIKGQYKTVFVGNQGSRDQRLRELMKAVAEVYASNFGPDPIEYRAGRGLLEFSEQMGIMIQEVVGNRVGSYYFPAYSGVARSRNNVQWLPGEAAEDGMVRIIPGLGTRALDRSNDQYPVLVVLGQPSPCESGHADEIARHAPGCIDVINMENNRLQTIELKELMTDVGGQYPGAEMIMSTYENGRIQPLNTDNPDSLNKNLVATFDGLIGRSPFSMQIRDLLRSVEEKLGYPVEIEFASDGEHIYILQCCQQYLSRAPRPAPIPKEMNGNQVVFSANRYISNGRVTNITHLVYIRPSAYEALEDPEDLQAVGRAVAMLNEILPKQQFVVFQPRVGTNRERGLEATGLTFNEYRNAAVLVDLLPIGEPEEFRVHFLQELVESGIKYIPVYPDDEESVFNERLLLRAPNILEDLIPEYAFLKNVIRVIDIPNATDGKVMQVLMNAELSEAVGVLTVPAQVMGTLDEGDIFEDEHPENYWRWRQRIAERIALQMDPVKFGVVGAYLFGSTKNGTAGPASDIDLLIHFKGTLSQREDLVCWLEGWSLCLDEFNFLRTGYRSGGLLDVHIVTDEDIANKNSYASKISAITDAARPLKISMPETQM
jgi:pyruvate,water dikinase